jgi:hypothetical protein
MIAIMHCKGVSDSAVSRCEHKWLSSYLATALGQLVRLFELLHTFFHVARRIVDVDLDRRDHFTLFRDQHGHVHEQLLELIQTLFDFHDLLVAVLA